MKPGVILCVLLLVLSVSAVQADVIVDGSALPTTEVLSININPANGDVTIITNNANWEIMQTGGGASRPSVDLRVNNSSTGATVDVNTAVSMSWNVSGANSCTASGGGTSSWAGSSIGLPSGSRSVTVTDVGAEVYRLTCSNAEGSTVDSVTVTGVDAEPTPTGCSNIPNVTVIDWSDLSFSGNFADWPRLAGVVATVAHGASQTVAIKFNTITAEAVSTNYGKMSNIEVAGVPGARQISISKCPGDFNDLPRRCVTGEIISSSSLYWELDNARGYSHTCKLDKGAQGESYYLNVRFPNGCGSQSTCQSYISPYYYQ